MKKQPPKTAKPAVKTKHKPVAKKVAAKKTIVVKKAIVAKKEKAEITPFVKSDNKSLITNMQECISAAVS
jgi:hypothetical protein